MTLSDRFTAERRSPAWGARAVKIFVFSPYSAEAVRGARADTFGIDAVCFFYPPDDERHRVDAPFADTLSDASLALPFFLYRTMEESVGSPARPGEAAALGRDHDELDDYKFIYDILPLLRDPRCQRIDHRPVLLVGRPDLLNEPQRTAALWREVAVQAGLGGLYLGAVCLPPVDPRSLGFDAIVEYLPDGFPGQGSAASEGGQWGAPAASPIGNSGLVLSAVAARPHPVLPVFGSAWDQIVRRAENATGSSTALLRLWATGLWLRVAEELPSGEAMAFVDAGDGWLEGATRETRDKMGSELLRAVQCAKSAVARYRGGGEPDTCLRLINWLRQIDASRAKGRRPIVVVSHDAARAGAQILLLRLLASIKETALDTDLFIILLRGGPLARDYAAIGAIFEFPETVDPELTREALVDLAVSGLATRISAPILCNTVVSAAFAAAAADAGLQTILYVHEMPTSIEMYVGGEAFVASACRCSTIITVSDNARVALAEAFPELASRIEVIRAGILPSVETRSPSRDADLLRFWEIAQDRPIVLGCGALHPRKGVDLFPLLAEMVFRAGCDAQFIWCGGIQGDREYFRWIEYDMRARGLGGRVRFLESVDDIGPFYRAASVFVLLSREDPFPLVVLEAADAELPVLAFNGTGGAVELLDGSDELCVPYGDVAGMAQRVCALLRDVDRRRNIGTSLKQRALSLCSWDAYVERVTARLAIGATGREAGTTIVG